MVSNKCLFSAWALLVLAALMIVYCGDSDDPTEPTDPLAGAALCLSEEICGVCPEGDSATVIEVTNCGNSTVLDWSATENSDWFDLSVSSGTTPGSFTVRADTNKTTDARTGEIIVAVAGLADAAETLSVSQPLFGSVIHVSVEEWTAAGGCDTSDAIAVTNCGNAGVLSWSAESDSSWLTILPSSGDTPGEFEIIADSNLTGMQRTAAITVTAAGITDGPAAISVTQLMLEPRLCVSLSEWEAPAAGAESQAISVVNCGSVYSLEYEVTAGEDWLTVSASSGSTPESFTITADANNTQEDRAASVTVTAEGVAGSPWDVSVTQQAIMALVGSYYTGGAARGVFVTGDYAYVADYVSGLLIIDVANPADPTLAGSYAAVQAQEVFVSGDYAYVVEYSLLWIFDVSDPADPTLAATRYTGDYLTGVYVSGNYAYIADGPALHSVYGGLEIYDVSDPGNPTWTGRYDTPAFAKDVFVCGEYAYVLDEGVGLIIIDVSDPANPTRAGGCSAGGFGEDIYLSGDYAYAVTPGDLQIIDVSDPSSPFLTGRYASGLAWRVFVLGDYAYVAYRDTVFQVVNVSNPSSPVLTGSYDTDSDCRGVFVTAGYAYVVDEYGHLWIFEIGL